MTNSTKKVELTALDFARNAPPDADGGLIRLTMALERADLAIAKDQVRILNSVREVAMKCGLDFDELLQRSRDEWKEELV